MPFPILPVAAGGALLYSLYKLFSGGSGGGTSGAAWAAGHTAGVKDKSSGFSEDLNWGGAHYKGQEATDGQAGYDKGYAETKGPLVVPLPPPPKKDEKKDVKSPPLTKGDPVFTEEEKGSMLGQEVIDQMEGNDAGVQAAKDDYKAEADYARKPPSGHERVFYAASGGSVTSRAWYAGWRAGYRSHLTGICTSFSCATVDEDGKIDWPFGIWGD